MSKLFYQAPFITKTNPIWAILFVLLLTSASCTKEEPKHRDVFRCEINGVAWEAGCDSQNMVWSCDYLDCQYYEDTGGFEITASNKIDNDGGFSLYRSSTSGGVIIGNNYLTIGTFGDRDNNIQFNISENNPGMLNILNINKGAKYIEGEFQFKAYSTNGDSVFISKGYFNVKYRP